MLTDDTIKKTQPNDGRDSEDRIPEQEICVLEYTVNVCWSVKLVCKVLGDSQARAPCIINLEPPQHADTHDILVEEVDNP
jgi:hypothetical protein